MRLSGDIIGLANILPELSCLVYGDELDGDDDSSAPPICEVMAYGRNFLEAPPILPDPRPFRSAISVTSLKSSSK